MIVFAGKYWRIHRLAASFHLAIMHLAIMTGMTLIYSLHKRQWFRVILVDLP